MKRALTLLILASGPLAAQPPRAQPAPDQPLAQDAAEGFFQRGKAIHDQAMAATDPQNRVQLFQRAAEVLEAYINEFPNHPNTEMAWYYLGNSYYMGGQPDNGKRCFHTLLNRYGKGKWAAAAAYTLANDHYSKGEYAFAAPLFERFAEGAGVVEERPRGNFYAGESYRMLGRTSEALSAYKKVLDDPSGRPFAAVAKLHSAQIQLKAGKTQEALTVFEDLLATPGNTPQVKGEATFGASVAAEKLGRSEAADKYLRDILVAPGMEAFRANAQTALMANAFERKDYKEVISIYRRISVPAPAEDEKVKEASRLMFAARSYMELKQPSDALQLFRQIEALVPPENELAFSAAYYRLHCFFQIEGHHVPEQVDGFLEIYRKTRPPGDPRIHTALFIKAETLFANKDNVAAAKVFSEIDVNALSEDNRPGLLYKRGWCLAETGDPQGAIRSFTEFLTKFPKDSRVPSALAKRAKAYAEIGESAKAIVDFDQLSADGNPEDLQSFAWLESARMRRAENNVQDMVLRYKGLLGKSSAINNKLQGEANYWIGWGLVKLNTAPEAVPYLEKARTLDPATYKKHAGLLLALGYHAAQDPQKLASEINLAIDGKYVADIPDQTLQWAGMQAYGGGDYKSAARFLDLIANPAEPRETAKEIWRYLAKSRLESGDNAGALAAAENVLAVEDNPGWKADGLVDKGRALFGLGRTAESRLAANEADALRPQGRTSALLRILSGDLFFNGNNLDQAGGDYINVVKWHEDADLKPLALHKLIAVYDKKGDKAEADKYRDQLSREFPNWKAP